MDNDTFINLVVGFTTLGGTGYVVLWVFRLLVGLIRKGRNVRG